MWLRVSLTFPRRRKQRSRNALLTGIRSWSRGEINEIPTWPVPFCARLEETQSLILRPTKCLRDIPVQATFAPNPSLVRMQASATQHTTHHATHGTSHTRLGKVVVGFSAAGVRYVLKERVWRPTTNCGTAQMKIPLPLNLKIGVPRNKGSRVEPLAILFLKKKNTRLKSRQAHSWESERVLFFSRYVGVLAGTSDNKIWRWKP